MFPPVFPAPLIKLWGQNLNFRSFLGGTYRNSLFQFPLCLRGFNSVRKVSCQIKPMPIKIQSHPLLVYLFSCRKTFLLTYLTSFSENKGSQESTVGMGESLLRDTTGRVAEDLNDSLEQGEPFPGKKGR